jgi:hypothetical protein
VSTGKAVLTIAAGIVVGLLGVGVVAKVLGAI